MNNQTINIINQVENIGSHAVSFIWQYSPTVSDMYKFAIGVTPIFVALIGLFQYRIAKKKFQLDLYNRRFEIYSDLLNFFQALSLYVENKVDEKEFKTKQQKFIKSWRETKFLFPTKSKIFDELGFINSEAIELIRPITLAGGWDKVSGAEVPFETDLIWAAKKTTALRSIVEKHKKVEDIMQKYMNLSQ